MFAICSSNGLGTGRGKRRTHPSTVVAVPLNARAYAALQRLWGARCESPYVFAAAKGPNAGEAMQDLKKGFRVGSAQRARKGQRAQTRPATRAKVREISKESGAPCRTRARDPLAVTRSHITRSFMTAVE